MIRSAAQPMKACGDCGKQACPVLLDRLPFPAGCSGCALDRVGTAGPIHPRGFVLGQSPAGGSGFYFFNVSLSLCNY